MKIINREKSGDYYFTVYEMDQSFSVNGCPEGLLLLYTRIVKDRHLFFVLLYTT